MTDNPYAQYANPYSVYGTPRSPPPQTPDQATGQSLQNTHVQQEIASQPLQNANTQTNIEQGHASIQNQHFNQNQGLRQEFNNLPEVKNYSVALQSLGTALKAPDTPQGDLSIIYAYAKAADPGSVVREGEMDMATATASLPQKYQADLARLTQGKRLPPQVRTGLIETMRQSVSGLRQVYDQQRDRYGTLAQQNGFNPAEIIGQPLYDAYRPLEEQYIRSHGQTPQDPNASLVPAAPGGTQQGFDLRVPPGPPPHAEEARQAMYQAMRGGKIKTADQMQTWLDGWNSAHGTNFTVQANDAALKAAQHGGAFNVETPQYATDITDVRGGNNTPGQDTINATARGVADTVSVGTIDKAVALGDTALKGGTFDQNLARQYAISDYDQKNHPFARLGGEALGGAVLPMGDVGSLGNLSLKGAAYGGAYGLGSSRELKDIPANVIGGAAVGAAVPALVGKFIHPKAGGIDPLVDPVTGELNVPMDSMTPAQRAAVMQGYGMKTITPGMAGGRSARIMEQAFNNLPGSAGHMEDVNAAASGQLRRSMQGVAQQFGQSKTLNEGGAELQRGANEYINRSQAVTAKAYNAIPIADKAQASTANTVATLRDLTGRFESNPDLAAAFQDKNLARYAAALEKGQIGWKDLKDFRSIIGEKIGQMRFGEGSSTSDLRALYAGLSQDMQDTAAAQGPRAVAAFNRANNLYRQQQQLIEGSLTRILGPEGNLAPEKAAAAVQAMTKGGKSTGDLKTLAQIKAATVKSGAWDEIASTLIHLGGQPANSEGRAFQPQTFVQWYSDMAEPARRMLFKPELRNSLDGFVAMTQQLGRLKGLANTSNTSPNVIGSGILMTAAASIMDPVLGLKLGGTLAGNYAMGKVWTSPAFVKLITGYGRAAMTGNRNAVQSQVGRLAKFAATNPEFSEPVQMILRQIANDNAPAAGSAIASPDQGPQDQTQAQ